MQTKFNIASRNTASKYFNKLMRIGIISEQKFKMINYCKAFDN